MIICERERVMSSDRIDRIREHLEGAFSPGVLEIVDESYKHVGHAGAAGGGGHFVVKIEGEAFEGKSRLEKHRMIYGALGEMMEGEIHALRIVS